MHACLLPLLSHPLRPSYSPLKEPFFDENRSRDHFLHCDLFDTRRVLNLRICPRVGCAGGEGLVKHRDIERPQHFQHLG